MESDRKAPLNYVEVTEQKRLNAAREQGVPWKKWGPYLSERQWGTVREDYSKDGNAWDYFTQNFSLRIETQVEQLRFVLDRVKSMLDEHPAIESGSSRVRVIGFAGAAFEFELFAYGKTGNWTELTAIRQDVLLKIADIVEAAGTRFAAPARLTYLSTDAGVDEEKTSEIVRHMTELRATDAFRFPGEARTGTK